MQEHRRIVRRTARPSNTSTNGKSFPETRIYVDKIRVRYSVRPEDSPLVYECDGYRWTLRPNFQGYTRFKHSLPSGAAADFEVIDPPDGDAPQTWTVEFNPSKFLYGENYTAGTSRDQLPEAVGKFQSELAALGYPGFDTAQATLRRLDLAYDFELEGVESGPILTALKTTHRSQRLKTTEYAGRGGAKTLYVGPGQKTMNSKGRWLVRIYDRTAYVDPTRCQGPLRIEVQLERDGLESAELVHLDDLYEKDLSSIMNSYWNKVGFDAHLTAGRTLLAKLEHYLRSADTAESKIAPMVGDAYGYVVQRDLNSGAGGYSPHLRRKYEELLRNAGCTAISWDDATAGYLDPVAGRFTPVE